MKEGELTVYHELLREIKVRVRQAQVKAAVSANATMLLMYWDVGRMIADRQAQQGWGAKVIPRLSVDLKNELPEEKQGWSRDRLTAEIKSNAHLRQGAAVTNFGNTLPDVHAELAAGLLKDLFPFDFLTLEEPFHERELETGLLTHGQPTAHGCPATVAAGENGNRGNNSRDLFLKHGVVSV